MTTQAGQLGELEQRYRSLTTQLAELGFISTGTILQVHTSCGRPGCRCMADPPRRHGPYTQLTQKIQGKTRTDRLTAEQARLLSDYIANYRRLQQLIRQMHELSEVAINLQLPDLR